MNPVYLNLVYIKFILINLEHPWAFEIVDIFTRTVVKKLNTN